MTTTTIKLLRHFALVLWDDSTVGSAVRIVLYHWRKLHNVVRQPI